MTDQNFKPVAWWVHATANIFEALSGADDIDRYDLEAITHDVYRWDDTQSLFIPRPITAGEFWALADEHYT